MKPHAVDAMLHLWIFMHAMYGGKGVPEDKAEAVRWLFKAADKENVAGCNTMAGYYSDGVFGVNVNIQEAVRLYRIVAAAGDDNACFT
jgi:TPR repeat protein